MGTSKRCPPRNRFPRLKELRKNVGGKRGKQRHSEGVEQTGKKIKSTTKHLFHFEEANSMKFKDEYSLEQRKAESDRIRQKYPDRIPVICEKVERSRIQVELFLYFVNAIEI